ncbi:MAG: DUF4493 domain-containing protein [Bacteroides sp.]|nr:DUF4493 domain-containing protein [Bacteroides sp.]
MRHLKFGIPILGAIILATGVMGCSDENPWGSSSNETGGIAIHLTTDNGITTAKPMFRGEDDEAVNDPHNLNTYITVPKSEDFSIRLEKADGSFTKTWTNLQGFLNYVEENFFSTGAYTITAYYGQEGLQDFNAPYFEASADFHVLSDQVCDIDLVAELKNSMVKVNYTDAFINYMDDYSATLRTEGRVDDIVFVKGEKDPAFIEPKDATLMVHITPKNQGKSTDIKVGDFPPMAKTLHNITLDVVENSNGYAQLELEFDDTLEEENIYIDLTDELFTSEAPVISCAGFSDGSTLEVIENSAYPSSVLMEVLSPGMVGEAKLIVESNSFTPKWGNEIDLCKAEKNPHFEELKSALGERNALGFGFSGTTSDVAVLDLSDFCKVLPLGTHKVSLVVTDKLGRPSNTASVTFSSQPTELEIVGNPTMGYCAKTATVTIDYNGYDPESELSFKTETNLGNSAEFTVISFEKLGGTRSIEKKSYIFELGLPDNVTANKDVIPLTINHKGLEMTSCNIDVKVPEYDLVYDAFSNYALVKVVLNDSENYGKEMLRAVTKNLDFYLEGKLMSDDIAFIDPENGYIAYRNLEAGMTFEVESSITRGDIMNSHASLTTETKLAIPNGDFSKEREILESDGDIQTGGQYKVSPTTYTLTSSFSVKQPDDWANINTKTAWNGAKNKNTWFIVPSAWLDDVTEEGVIRSVGYSHDGKTPATSGGVFNTKYYCENAPSDDDLQKAAGELFLGSYSFNGTESRTEGIAFASRPTSISFDYNYEPATGKDDRGYAKIELLDTDGNTLGSKIFELERGSRSESYAFEYTPFSGKKAAKLIVSFKSSNQEVPPIHIPSGSELKEESINTGNFTRSPKIPANTYKAVATGSVLRIDNVMAHYGDENTPAAAPKKKTKKRK